MLKKIQRHAVKSLFLFQLGLLACTDASASDSSENIEPYSPESIISAEQPSINLETAKVIYTDNFNSGDFALNDDSTIWTDKAMVSIVELKDGNKAADFNFKGNHDLSADAMSELRFDLGKLYTEFWMQFDVYIPKNYTHRDGESTDNNKFFRLWPETYSDSEKIGASLMRDKSNFGSLIAIDYSKQADWGLSLAAGGTASDYISINDLGKWIRVKVYIKTASTSSFAEIAIYKNGSLFIQDSPALDYNPSVNGVRYGYLLGWSNSGFDEDTHILIDNFYITENEPDL